MAENRFISAQVTNNTGYLLRAKAAQDPSWGKWVTPPRDVPAKATMDPAFYASGAAGSATGTEGKASWAVGDTGYLMTISWDIPYTGKNTFAISCSDPAIVVSNDGAQHEHDNGCNVRFTVGA